jgi:hypothetical protein
MLDERPSATELIAAVAAFLEREVKPALEGRLAFHATVAVNALRIVQRELDLGPAAVSAELARLREITGADGDLSSLNSLLAERIRTGEVADSMLRAHLVRSVLARIAIDNPKYPSLREIPDYWPLP